MEKAQVARDHKEENHYNTVLYVKEAFSCTSRATDLLISEETKKTTNFHTANFNEDRESAIYETLKVETMEDKPSDEIGEYSGDIKAATVGNVLTSLSQIASLNFLAARAISVPYFTPKASRFPPAACTEELCTVDAESGGMPTTENVGRGLG
ncbi:hypothetical protein UY3_02589 [Chelonia mydas]|uniref:Uncharacterized protein n=1 Tax=Chelonia mydas TaxID=8469 RepID=M7CGY9_CHEMY|nr:hypothetical protein UY3_02589 [Chelonia mydas]